ncbi:MAG: PHP domain-containing protein [Bacteroidota bacterium]
MNIWSEISSRLKEEPGKDSPHDRQYPRVNTHIHTPWSFSSFSSIDDIIEAAGKENIRVLGINDFNTLDGFDEWAAKCFSADIFPLFNIEMTGLNRNDQEAGRRVNDPNNPGRTYISGKALAYPVIISEEKAARLKQVRDRSNEHVRLMTMKVNELLGEIDAGIMIDFDEMLAGHTKGMARERHLAGMIRKKTEEKYPGGSMASVIFHSLLGDDFNKIKKGDRAGLENLIRSKLLKAGGAAFVEEDPEIFIEPAEIRDLILDAGGIPTYPFLADFNDGMYTDFEGEREEAASELMNRGFCSVEFIPARNDYVRFRDYVMFLYDRGFIITFGTEHNAPGIKPLEVRAARERALDDELMKINYEGACILAAHQFLVATEGSGYLDESGRPRARERDKFIARGNRIIKSVISGGA